MRKNREQDTSDTAADDAVAGVCQIAIHVVPDEATLSSSAALTIYEVDVAHPAPMVTVLAFVSRMVRSHRFIANITPFVELQPLFMQ